MLKIILIIVVILAIALTAYIVTRPDSFSVQRSTSIKAAPEKVFALVNDFHNWGAWSPWEKMDPALKRTYSGTTAGKGTIYEWSGNAKVGTGRMEITESSVPSRIDIKLDFLKPFEAHNVAEFTFEVKGDTTNVTWIMHGPNQFMSKIMGLFMSMDKMIGREFETGLANMKAAAEK
jgi:hypothetical protein